MSTVPTIDELRTILFDKTKTSKVFTAKFIDFINSKKTLRGDDAYYDTFIGDIINYRSEFISPMINCIHDARDYRSLFRYINEHNDKKLFDRVIEEYANTHVGPGLWIRWRLIIISISKECVNVINFIVERGFMGNNVGDDERLYNAIVEKNHGKLFDLAIDNIKANWSEDKFKKLWKVMLMYDKYDDLPNIANAVSERGLMGVDVDYDIAYMKCKSFCKLIYNHITDDDIIYDLINDDSDDFAEYVVKYTKFDANLRMWNRALRDDNEVVLQILWDNEVQFHFHRFITLDTNVHPFIVDLANTNDNLRAWITFIEACTFFKVKTLPDGDLFDRIVIKQNLKDALPNVVRYDEYKECLDYYKRKEDVFMFEFILYSYARFYSDTEIVNDKDEAKRITVNFDYLDFSIVRYAKMAAAIATHKTFEFRDLHDPKYTKEDMVLGEDLEGNTVTMTANYMNVYAGKEYMKMIESKTCQCHRYPQGLPSLKEFAILLGDIDIMKTLESCTYKSGAPVDATLVVKHHIDDDNHEFVEYMKTTELVTEKNVFTATMESTNTSFAHRFFKGCKSFLTYLKNTNESSDEVKDLIQDHIQDYASNDDIVRYAYSLLRSETDPKMLDGHKLRKKTKELIASKAVSDGIDPNEDHAFDKVITTYGSAFAEDMIVENDEEVPDQSLVAKKPLIMECPPGFELSDILDEEY